jgi:low temperature requirement A protein (LtrA)
VPEQDDGAVGMLELFFDLVFVYTMSQVTSLMSADISWPGFGHGALALAAIWWAWVCFAWLTATADEAGPLTQTVIFLAMTAMLIAAIGLPKAFGEHARARLRMRRCCVVGLGVWCGRAERGPLRACAEAIEPTGLLAMYHTGTMMIMNRTIFV